MTWIVEVPVEDLDTSCVTTEPEQLDWGLDQEEGDAVFYRYAWHEPVECETCGRTTILVGPPERRNVPCGGECGSSITSQGPSVSAAYRLPSEWPEDRHESVHAAAWRIRGLNLCLVDFEDSGAVYLTQTGGFYDANWEIAQGFLALGFLPPAHLRLTPTAGMRYTHTREYTLDAMSRSLDCLSAQVAVARLTLDHTRAILKGEVA